MERIRVLMVCCLALFSLGGCATIIHGTTQDIGITTDPSGAELLVDGSERYRSPAKITMKRKYDHFIEVSKEGYHKETVNIKSVLSGAVAGNILAGGLIGWGVDAASGGQYRLVPENVDLRLRPLTEAPEHRLRPIPSLQSTGGQGPEESIEERLDQLRKLKERGKITEAEYEKMRQEILATAGQRRLTTPPQSRSPEPSPPKPIPQPVEPKKETPKEPEKVSEI
jgi:hypothetical protein